MSRQVIGASGVLCAVAFLTAAITFGVLWSKAEFFTVDGTFERVDQCKTNCFAGVGPNGCLYHPAITLSWLYKNETFSASNFSVPANRCRQCCYGVVNSSILVEIDPAVPSVAKNFWFSNQAPENDSYFALACFFGILALFSLLLSCAVCDGRCWSYERLK